MISKRFKQQHKKNKSAEMEMLLNIKSKEYRQKLNERSSHQEKTTNELRQHFKLRTLKTFLCNKKCILIAGIFRNLNGSDEDTHIDIDIDAICDNPGYDIMIHGEICLEEISDSIMNLKNNKSPRFDNISIDN